MKTLKINKLQANKIPKKAASCIKGGKKVEACCCGCLYADKGGSSSTDNFNANVAGLLASPGAHCPELVVITA